MSKYRARQCPNCHYFVGFAVAKSFVRGVTASLTNFCLNCNYKLPVHTIVRGNGAVKRRSRRPKLRLIVGASDSVALIGVDKRQSYTMDTKISPADYARHCAPSAKTWKICISPLSTWSMWATRILSGC